MQRIDVSLETVREAVDKAEGNYTEASRLLADKGIFMGRDSIRRRMTGEIDMDADLSHLDVTGISRFEGPNGELKGRWVKQNVNAARRAALLKESIAEMCKDMVPVRPVKPPALVMPDLLNLYTLTDCHVGMNAWQGEGKAKWNLGVAERVLIGCMQEMLDASPDADVGFISILGDFLHYDGLLPVTPTSGHILDADGRFFQMGKLAIRLIKMVIDMALKKHSRVVILVAEGNHDMSSSFWLRQMVIEKYENEPRVEVIDADLPYYAYRWGDTALFFHHSHLKKIENLPLFFATEFYKVWGKTTKRYGHTGDKHHLHVKETNGIIMRQHPTLAAKDAYAARHGWDSLRTATAITYHRKHGEVSTKTVHPGMIAA